MTTRNYYYSDPQKFDLAKMRVEAHASSRGDQFNEPRDAIIHYHSHEHPCKYPEVKDTNHKHEFYAAVIGEDK